ncbi:3-isopropylmalate dehydratase [Herbaspirillum rubrisubalbicans]|uniref:3-isopropylmalate dehydratase small subunit n=1 Tax=Herbaspirillum rubrisubalbicans TaxID=80842 RepID=A0ABX9BWV7_9BURK|nr:3-isopropylmalate dehydratase small subunit [Herbaspirillum rubrisubalbicans]NQE48931.1 3-isopropylmalate dehydratase [Herbaspirillum rubrisubalbicans]RAM62221.1 3-isopropylmalate dehydratase [Herbaspirillum rubrisubalbicans]RAN50054.1 3-isopropylmalate dehydratase [Herbaspirillum rubrisubalbicans]
MTPIREISGTVAVLDRNNVDTDAIIPKQFMKSIGRTGFGPYAFDAWRYLDDGYWGKDCSKRLLNPDFELNAPRFQGATILLTGKNFGCGSSREHAPWALADYGFQAILAESFADIFHGNCLKNGILAIRLEAATLAQMRELVMLKTGCQAQIDLPNQHIRIDDTVYGFEIDTAWKERLLKGLDDISLTLEEKEFIHRFEEQQHRLQPWLYR